MPKGISMKAISLLGLTLCVLLGVWGIHTGVLTSQQEMESLITKAGWLGPALFMLLQAVQVVLPIIPGGISCLAGVVLFGAVKGFIYNYVGICIGSLIAFGAARACGRPVLIRLFGQEAVSKYDSLTEKKERFDKLFALAIFLPVAPDDILCYLAGTTQMTWKRFTVIILLGKPFAIFMYSIFLSAAWTHIIALFN